MSDNSTGPSAWQIQMAMRLWHERQQRMAEEDGELHDEAELDGLAGVQTAILRAIRDAGIMATGINQERQTLAARQKRIEAREQNLRNTLAAIVEITERPDRDGKRRLVLPTATLTLAPGGRKIEIADDQKIPDEYYDEIEMVKHRRGLKKAALIEALTAERIDETTGEVTPPQTIEGVALSNAPPVLTIRTK